MARGIAARSVGDEFINDDQQKLKFKKFLRFPTENLRFSTLKSRDDTVYKVQSQYKNIHWTNHPSRSHMAFCLAVTEDVATGEDFVIGRYFKELNLHGQVVNWTGKKNFLGFSLNTKNGRKERSPYSPSEILDGYLDTPLSRDDLQNIISKKIVHQNTRDGLLELLDGNRGVTFKDAYQRGDAESIRDYACELIHPILLSHSHLTDTNISEIFPDVDPGDLRYMWISSKNHKLVDSLIVHPDGSYLGVSSKGNKGAYPSVTNIYDVFDTNPTLVNEHPHTYEVLKVIKDHSSKEAPIVLSERLGVVPSPVTQYIKNLGRGVKLPRPPEVQLLAEAHDSKVDKMSYSEYLHLLSNLAKMTAAKLNSDPKFSDSLVAAYNKIKVVQVYTMGMRSGDDLVIRDFESFYTRSFNGKIFLDAGKHYTSSIIKGKMTMKVVN